MSNNFKYTFYVDGDVYDDLSYSEYLKKPKLMALVTDYNRRRLFLGTVIYSYSHDWLLEHQDKKNEFEFLANDARFNKLKYFCPNSKEQLAFINDDEHDVVSMIAPNRIGKTTVGAIKVVTSGILPLDPTWPVFTKHGVKFRPFLGKEREMKMAFGSYEWSHIKSVVWPRVKEYIPDQLLGVYSRGGHNGKKKEPNFERQPYVELGCGTMLKFHAYSQSQANFESDAYNGFMYDEQPPENIFNAIDERTRTLRGKHIFTLTPHKVEGMPGTGGGGWLQKFLTGEEKRGHNISSYNTSLGDVPDWIYPESEKIKAFSKWVHEPTRNRNMKMLREGRSRIFGEWHKTSGLVIDEWDRAVHVIDDFKVPDEWTRYRALDHGVTNPTVCLWIAVSPPKGDFGSDVIVYREYYSQGKTINENVMEVVNMSGNTRRKLDVGSGYDLRSGTTMISYEEVQTAEAYAKTVLDSRSFANTDTNTGKPYGYIYKMCGLPCTPASGKNSQHWVPILNELFAPKLDEEHKYNKGVSQRPRLMIFRSCMNLVREIESWIWEEYRSGGDQKNAKESPRKKDDHGCTALAYACQIPLRYRGDINKVVAISDSDSEYRRGSSDDGDGEYRGV